MTSKNYILVYYQQIKDGSVVVGRWIEKWYEYIVNGLQEKKFFFDQKKANTAIAFIQQYCRHHEGSLAPQLIKLEVWQKALLSIVFGILDSDGLRQFRECFVVMGRKNGKTLLDAAIAVYMSIADNEYGGRIYFSAPKLDQSRLAFEAYYQMISKDPRLSAKAKKRRTDVYFADNNTSAMPVAFSERKTDGLNPSYISLDELSSWRGEAGQKQYSVFRSALGARKQPLMFGISTAGYENDGIYDDLINRATALLNGNSSEKRFAPFLYMVDPEDVERWNDISIYPKSNPNLGVSVTVDYLLEEIRIAEGGSLAKKNEILTKYLNVKCNSSEAWLTAQDIQKGFNNHFALDDFKGHYCLCGIDLSQTVDLSAAVVGVMKKGVLYYFTQFFLPANKLDEAITRDGLPYREYIKKGYLTLSGENFIDYHDVFDWMTNLIKTYDLYPLRVGYDRYSAQYLIQDLEQNGFLCDSVIQGGNLTGVLNDMEGMIKDGLLQCANQNELMKAHLLDVAIKYENDTNRKRLVKIRKNGHIDGVAALSDMMCMRHNYLESMPQLRNE